MKNKIYAEHRRLVRTGKYRKARRILHMLLAEGWGTMLCEKPKEGDAGYAR